MKLSLLKYIAIGSFLLLAACASSPFVSSWRAPDAQPLHLAGSKVAAIVMTNLPASRRDAEDILAREITSVGAIGIPLYTVLPNLDPDNELALRQALEKAGFAGAVVMRPVGSETKITTTPSMYGGPRYSGFWGGYYGYGSAAAWGPDIESKTIVYVETLVYSLKQNKLVWGGQSKTTNPSSVDRLIKDTAKKVARELEEQGLITKQR